MGKYDPIGLGMRDALSLDMKIMLICVALMAFCTGCASSGGYWRAVGENFRNNRAVTCGSYKVGTMLYTRCQ